VETSFQQHIRTPGWPTAIEQLLPKGPKDTIAGLARWLSFSSSLRFRKVTFQVITTIIGYTSPLVLPHLVTPGDKSRLILCARDLMWDGYELLKESDEPPGLIAVSASATFLCMLLLDRCTEVHRTMMMRDEANYTLSLMAQCNDILPGLQQVHASPRYPASARLAQSSLVSISTLVTVLAHDTLVRGDWRPYSTFEHLSRRPPASTWTRTVEAIDYGMSGRCNVPQCPRTILESGPFGRCGGCRRAFYCSRRCQRTAWRHPVAPHREVCEAIRRICVDHDLPPNDAMRVIHKRPETFNEKRGQHIVEHTKRQVGYELAQCMFHL
jgi:hypothetical protein